MPVDILDGPTPLSIYHLGPPLENGRLPAIFYFALSGQESLTTDPYNQPAALWKELGIRVFSFTLPDHGIPKHNRLAMAAWQKRFLQDPNFIDVYIDQCIENIHFLIEQKIIDPLHLASAGLSRGAFIATHLAAREELIGTLLGFAPLTNLMALDEFNQSSTHAHMGFVKQNLENSIQLNEKGSLFHLAEKLIKKKIRYYIGNRDIRVGTEQLFNLVKEIADQAYRQGIRSPSTELFILSSIGHKGHGTTPATFCDGATWLAKTL